MRGLFYWNWEHVVRGIYNGAKSYTAKLPLEKNGVIDLKHGAFKCMGAVIEPRSVLTCCTCVSDVYFVDPTETDATGYEVRALDPMNLTMKTDRDTMKADEVLLHPDCDVDGSYDYAIVRIEDQTASKAQSSGRGRTNHVVMYSLNSAEVAQRTKFKNKTCALITNVENQENNSNQTVVIPVNFVEEDNCWASSDTAEWFDSKYCIKSQDGSILSEIKTGSPIFCENKLIGISARRYATSGRTFCAVNGIDGALDFIKETLDVTLPKPDIEEDEFDESEGKIVGKKLDQSTEMNEALIRGS